MDNDLELLKHLPYMSPMTNRVEASKQKGFTEDFDIASATQMVSNGSKKTLRTRRSGHCKFLPF